MSDIVIKDVNFAYNNQTILKDINLSFTCKEFLAIIGPNGGGKTTLLKLILGLIKPNSGEIYVFGKKPNLKTSNIAYVPQNTNINLNFPITVLDIVLMGRLKRKWFSFFTKDDYREAMKSLEQVGMSEFRDVRIGELSGGQRQRVFIARALSTKSRLILLDEPTASIDTSGQIQVFELLKELNKSRGIMVISHDINIALGYASSVAHINRSLYMHQVPSMKAKETLLQSFREAEGHICPVEIVAHNICTHEEAH